MAPADDKLILISLLVKLGVAAAVAAGLARSNRFKRLLLMTRRRPGRRWGCWRGSACRLHWAFGYG